MIEQPKNIEGASISPSVEIESEPKPTFTKDDLHILANRYGSFDVGFQNFRSYKTPSELRLVTIENFPTAPGSGDNQGIWGNIFESLPNGEIDYGTFKSTVQDVVSTLFEGKKADVKFPNDQHFSYAIQCMVEDSLEPAKKAGEEVSEDVRKIFGYQRHQFYE